MKSKSLIISAVICATMSSTAVAETLAAPKVEASKEVPSPFAIGATLDASVLPDTWLRGEPVSSFKDGVVYVMDFWAAPPRASRSKSFYKRVPGFYQQDLMKKYADSSAIEFFTVCVSGDTDKVRLNKFLALPEYKLATHSIALDGFKGEVSKNWLRPAKVEYIPYSVVIRDSIVLWHGESDRVSNSLITAAVKPDFTLEKYQATQKKREEFYKEFATFKSKINEDYKAKVSPNILLKRLEEKEKSCADEPYLMLVINEMKFGFHVVDKDYNKAIAIYDALIDERPKDVPALKRMYKYLISTEELKPASNKVIIKCLAHLAEVTETEYATRSWAVIGEMKKADNDIQGAIEAYQKSVDISDATKRLKIIKAGGTPPLAN